VRRIVWVVAFDSWQLIRDYRWWLGLAFALVVALVLLRWLLGTFLGHQRCSPWRAHVRAGADALRHQLTTLPPGHGQAGRDRREAVAKAVDGHLRAACQFASWEEEEQERGPSVGRQFNDWWTGASCEGAYINLHEAEIIMAPLLPEDELRAAIPVALARLQTMDVTDPRRRAAETQLASGAPSAYRRAAFQSAVRVGLELIDQQHARLRGFRNIVLTTTVGLMLLVIAMCLVGAWKPDALPLCFGPSRRPARARRCRSRGRSGWRARRRRRRRRPAPSLGGSPLPATSPWSRSSA